MNYYLCPTASFTVGSQTFTGPEYMQTDLAGQNYTCIPYGVESIVLIATAENAALAAESDVYAFPSDLTELVTDTDVMNLDTYLGNVNIPSSFVTSGMAWRDVLLQIAQIFLVAQAVSGAANNASIFPSGATVDSSLSSPAQSSGNLKLGGSQQQPSALATAAGSVVGPFDLTDVDTSDTIGDTLISVSQQFNQPIILGNTELA